MSQQLEIGLFAENVVRRDGQGRVMLEIAKELLSRGHTVHVFAVGLAEELQGKVSWHAAPSVPAPQIVRDSVYARWSRRQSAKTRLDAALTMGACTRPHAPVCYYAAFTHAGWFSRWTESGFRPSAYHRLHSFLLRRSEKKVLASADKAVAISQGIAEELSAISRSTPAEVVPAGVDSSEFSRLPDPASARRSLGIDGAAFCIGLIGEHATGRKGLDDLARAVHQEGDGDELILVHGHGPVDRSSARAERLGMGGRVLFPNPAIPVPVVLAASDIVAIPSIYEPFSLVALEALAAGVPVVISERAGVAELLGPAGAALVVDATDAGSLGAAISDLRRDPSLAEQLVKNAEPTLVELSWPKVSARVASVIESIAIPASSDGEGGRI